MALSTARIDRVRGRPPLLAAGIISLIHSHSSSVRSLGYIFSFIYPFYTTHEDFSDRLLAPVPVAPVNTTDMVLFPEGLKALKQVAKEVGLDLRGAYVNLDGGFDSAHNRKCIFNAGMIPGSV